MNSTRLLNFGCGTAFHPAWVNLDASPVSPLVIAHDLRRGLPYAEDSFDGVYGSHVIEHLDPVTASFLLRDCFRVLRPDGIVRVVVPDLEAIVRLYLQSLDGALAGNAESQMHYDWAMLELYDQVTRTKPGGKMAVYLRSALDERQAQFVASRIGDEVAGLRAAGIERYSTMQRIIQRLQSATLAMRRLAAVACSFVLLGPEGGAALREGIFRRGGEVHQWMYDRFSMKRVLEQIGFLGVRSCAAGESDIPDFARYGLETIRGQARKPDSLYIEGRKPSRT